MRRNEILVVEDHPELRAQLRGLFELAGFDVRTASDGEEALAALALRTPQVVVLDLVLPEISGYEVCEHIRGTPSLRHVPVAVISGRALAPDRAYAFDAGANTFLSKPFAPEALLAEVQRLLSSAEPSATVAA